ncbi:ABC transporter permease [Haladaptatus sp. AB643]|uniref:ABC transporter permease n=1 Tax=Haladaptatus sp. AB643 TaxID=2934174 RepID=UPI00209C5E22|nr:ABC transporter permease [Haladaptatus sp. AB643]
MSYGSEGSNAASDSDVAGVLTLFAAVLRKRVLLLVRYPMNTLAQIVTVYLFFAVIFFGGKAAAGSIGAASALSGTFGGLIVGWFLWTMALAAYFSLATSITREAQWGTLEQLYMSPYGFGAVMVSSVVAYLLESMLWGAIILPLMLVTTGQHLAVDLLTVVPIVVLTLLPVVGIGFVFAGLALLYKRIENVSQLMQFVLIGLIAAPVADFEPLRYLPLVQGSAMLQRAMQNGVRLWQFPATDLAILVAAAVGYCLFGFYVFTLAARRARRQGVLGHY